MKPIRTLKISISGVRGVIGDSLSPTLLTRFAESFGTYLNSGKIVVGRDTRTSGEMVKHAVFAGLLATGCPVVDLDICPVPTIQLMVRKLGALATAPNGRDAVTDKDYRGRVGDCLSEAAG